MNSQSKRSGQPAAILSRTLAFITAVSFPGSKEAVPTREVEKDNLVGLLHSFLIAAPRVIAINDPVFMIAEKLSHLTSPSNPGHCLSNPVEIEGCPYVAWEWSSGGISFQPK